MPSSSHGLEDLPGKVDLAAPAGLEVLEVLAARRPERLDSEMSQGKAKLWRMEPTWTKMQVILPTFTNIAPRVLLNDCFTLMG